MTYGGLLPTASKIVGGFPPTGGRKSASYKIDHGRTNLPSIKCEDLPRPTGRRQGSECGPPYAGGRNAANGFVTRRPWPAKR
jgi:hypothetical protein